MDSICLLITDEAQRTSAVKLAKELDIALVEDRLLALKFRYQLNITAQGLELLVRHSQGESRLFVDLVKGAIGYRRAHGGGYRQAIAKAVGIKNPHQTLTVVDATAGLGRDAFMLACLGCKLHLIERSPVIAALLKDGLDRALREPKLQAIVQERIKVSVGDALHILARNQDERPDIIYLDPMFPQEDKTALTTIDIRIIRDIVGKDLDAEKLFLLALKIAKHRVVVKRPIRAASISALKPSFSLTGKKNRYDVYMLTTHFTKGR